MSIWGKIIGGAAGFALGGPIGALVGALAGHAVDHMVVERDDEREDGQARLGGQAYEARDPTKETLPWTPPPSCSLGRSSPSR